MTNRQLLRLLPVQTSGPGDRENAAQKTPAAKGCKGQREARHPDFRKDRKCFRQTRAGPATQSLMPRGTGFVTGSRSGCVRVGARLFVVKREREKEVEESFEF